jgi:hypothetical protein
MIGRDTAHYTAAVFGWMTIIEASTKREALQEAKARAPGASLLRTDVTEAHIRLSTPEDIAWYGAQGGT